MPGPAYILMAEWQGSSSSRAMQLVEGASALREDLPSTTVEVPVPLGAGDTLGTPALRLSSVLRSRDAAAQALRELNAPHITVGGDCASTFAGLAASIARHGADRLAVLWFDAHPDLQHPATSPSGAISGMALRHALGEGVEDLAFADPVRHELLTLVGTRAFDDEEVVEVASRGIAHIAVPADPGVVAGTTEYPAPFTCAVAQANIFATQFHPEKSHRAGLRLLANFVAWNGCD